MCNLRQVRRSRPPCLAIRHFPGAENLQAGAVDHHGDRTSRHGQGGDQGHDHDRGGRRLAGSPGWQKGVGYGRRSLVETGMLRYKTIIGRALRARTLPAQMVEARVGCKVLNRMTALGMPVSRRLV